MSAPERRCDLCDHAAMNQGGVWCTMFAQQILDEKVAEECGLYANDECGPQGIVPNLEDALAKKRNSKKSHPSQQPQFVSTEAERTLTCEVTFHYFGKEKHGDDLFDTVEKKLRQQFGMGRADRVKVVRVD